MSDADAERFRAAARAELDQARAVAGPAPTVGSGRGALRRPRDRWDPAVAPARRRGRRLGRTRTDRRLGARHQRASAAHARPRAPRAGSRHGDIRPAGRSSADLARLDAARSRASSLINSGLALLALGLVITVGTMALAPGGFFIVSFGTVFVGFRRIRAGRMIQAQVRHAEQQLGP